MPSIADNVRSMAALVAEVKKDHRLTENTVMRIIDMNFALAQGAGISSLGGGEDLTILEEEHEDEEEPTPFPSAEQIPMFTDDDLTNGIDEDEVLATVEHKEMN